jgi:hypothetical protein
MGLFLTGSSSLRTKWTLVAHTSAIFSLVTVYMAISFNILSVSYVDNREFPGADAAAPPGPLGHQFYTDFEAENVVRTLAYVLSSLLADGLLVRLLLESIAQVLNGDHCSQSYIVSGSFIL